MDWGEGLVEVTTIHERERMNDYGDGLGQRGEGWSKREGNNGSYVE